MLDQFFSAFGYFWAAVFVLWCIAMPFLALWLAFSIRKSLVRIATTLELATLHKIVQLETLDDSSWERYKQIKGRVANSVLGR